MTSDNIEFKVSGDEQIIRSLKEMQDITSNRIAIAGLRKAGNLINKQAKTNFINKRKNKSKTGYGSFNSLFKVQPLKNPKKLGVKVGLTGYDAYKYKWLNWGTVDRSYKKGGDSHLTGKIQPTMFLTNAVNSTMEEAHKIVSDALITSIKKIASK
jgi:HK97 gp10 family phage protein